MNIKLVNKIRKYVKNGIQKQSFSPTSGITLLSSIERVEAAKYKVKKNINKTNKKYLKLNRNCLRIMMINIKKTKIRIGKKE